MCSDCDGENTMCDNENWCFSCSLWEVVCKLWMYWCLFSWMWVQMWQSTKSTRSEKDGRSKFTFGFRSKGRQSPHRWISLFWVRLFNPTPKPLFGSDYSVQYQKTSKSQLSWLTEYLLLESVWPKLLNVCNTLEYGFAHVLFKNQWST